MVMAAWTSWEQVFSTVTKDFSNHVLSFFFQISQQNVIVQSRCSFFRYSCSLSRLTNIRITYNL